MAGLDVKDRQEGGTNRGGLSAKMGAVIFTIAVIVFVAEQISIAAVNGWWTDELYSLWSTDPSLTFFNAFSTRFGLDPTPPLYYAALYWLRDWISLPVGQERVGVYILNIGCILMASAAVIGASQRAGLSSFALAGIAAFLLSGPVLTYVPEARAYLMAMAIVFVTSWFVALAIEKPGQCPYWAYFALLGVLAGLTHFYTALMCGGLAAGLIFLAIFANRRDLVAPGLALGLAASITFAAWFFIGAGLETWHAHPWLKFTLKKLSETGWNVRSFVIGGRTATVALLILLLFALMHRPTRFLTIAFGIAFALFVILPICISFKTPIIVNRYWLVGGPALVVLMVFFAKAGLIEGRSNMKPLLLGFGAIALLLSSSVTGYLNAHLRTENKPIWDEGAKIVAPLIHDCPAGTIHVPPETAYIGEYAQMAHAPIELFADAKAPATTWITHASCPVLGWAEHIGSAIDDDFLIRATDRELLQFLKIDIDPAKVDIRRRRSGYVVLRRNL